MFTTFAKMFGILDAIDRLEEEENARQRAVSGGEEPTPPSVGADEAAEGPDAPAASASAAAEGPDDPAAPSRDADLEGAVDAMEQLVTLFGKPLPNRDDLTAVEYGRALVPLIPTGTLAHTWRAEIEDLARTYFHCNAWGEAEPLADTGAYEDAYAPRWAAAQQMELNRISDRLSLAPPPGPMDDGGGEDDGSDDGIFSLAW